MQTQENPTVADPALVRAQKHVKHVRDFFYHLMVYVLVNVMLVVIDRRSAGNDGFMGHAISVFFGDYRVRKLYAQERKWEAGSR